MCCITFGWKGLERTNTLAYWAPFVNPLTATLKLSIGLTPVPSDFKTLFPPIQALMLKPRRHDIQLNDTQNNDTQHLELIYDTQHKRNSA